MATCNTNGTSFDDQFNNPSNDYVYPALSPCAGTGEDRYLEFIDKGIGIVSGSNTLAKIDFSNLKIPVSSYSTEEKILGPGEVDYIPGLTKGLIKRQQGFTMPNLVSTNLTLNPLFFGMDLSVNYYKNFSYTENNISVTSDYSQNINIQDALNIAFGVAGIKINAAYDPSTFIFKGTSDGYDFAVSNVILSIIDASENSSSPFAYQANADEYNLVEDQTVALPYAKYSNGAMQGIIMKGIYSNGTPLCPYDHWLYINHVPDQVVIYEPIKIDHFTSELERSFDPSITFGPFVGNIAVPTYDNSILYDISIGPAESAVDCSIIDCSIIDSSIYGGFIGPAGYITNSAIENTAINIFMVDASERVIIQTSIINDSSVWNCTISDSSIYNSLLYDVSLVECTLYNSKYEISTLEDCRDIRINETIDISTLYIDSSTYYEKTIKRLDVGLNGSSTDEVMSAGDYLAWITENDYWNKFGDMYSWTSSADAGAACDNLINGFYVFNPQTFNIKIEYMILV